MITDTIENIGGCPVTGEHLGLILDFIKRCGSALPAEGRYPLDGQELFALTQAYLSKPQAELSMESHALYADLQVVLSGSERMLWSRADELEPSRDLRPDTDMIFYREAPARGDFILDAGMFAYFAPRDAHAPCGQRTEGCPEKVEKIVFKIRQRT